MIFKKLAQYILDHKEISNAQVPTIRNFGGEHPVYKDIKHTPTSKAIDMLAEEFRDRPPVYPNVRKEVYWPTVKQAALWSAPADTFAERSVLQPLDYARYLLGHKYNVAAAGVHAGVSPWTLVKHDYSKFRPKMFSTYTKYFFGPEGIKGTKDESLRKDFRTMAEWHYAKEDHHNDKVGLPKDIATEIESVCDWYSVGKTNADMQGQTFPNFVGWWKEHKDRLLSTGKISKLAYEKLNSTVELNYNLFTYSIDKIKELFN